MFKIHRDPIIPIPFPLQQEGFMDPTPAEPRKQGQVSGTISNTLFNRVNDWTTKTAIEDSAPHLEEVANKWARHTEAPETWR
jgi:hypothetical protein